MKKVALGLCFLALVGFPIKADDSKQKRQEFEVTYTITYNSITLAEAAKREMEIKKQHRKACKVKTSVKEISDFTASYITFDGSRTITTDVLQ